MSKATSKNCLKCGDNKPLRDYYTSLSPMYANDKLLPFCKSCLIEMVDPKFLEKSAKDLLRQIDRPFLVNVWGASLEEAKNGDKSEFGTYMKNLAMPHNRKLTWEDSDDKPSERQIKMADKVKEQGDELVRREDLTQKDIQELEDIWGFGHDPQELIYFERKYDSLIGNYPLNTSLHREALRAYCVYKVKAEIETARGNAKDAKTWAELAQKQGDIAKININKLDKSDLSQGLDSFSELVRMVEREVDIIPILPQFIERPHDEIDLGIYSFINYERRLHGKPDVEHSDIYDFYQDSLRTYLNDKTKSEGIKKNIKEIEIYSNNPETDYKKKILFYDVYAVIEEKKKAKPNDSFIQNLDKWMEFVSWSRWFPDLWFDLVTPNEDSDDVTIKLDIDQRMMMRTLARFKFVYCVFPRGWGKCITGDSLLFTSEGMKEIGEYFNYQNDGVETYTEHNIDMVNRFGKLENSDKGVYSGFRQTKKIKTEEGYEIEGTEEHPLLVMNKSGELEWTKLQDLEEGDFITVNRENDVWGNKTKLEIDMDSWLETFGNDSRWKIEANKCDIIDELDEEMALIMGYLIGDGCLTRSNVTIFSNIDQDILRNYTNFMENKLGVKVKKKKGKGCDYLVNGMFTREYLRQVGLDQVNSHNKQIPNSILTAPKNIVKQFMIGLFDTDGTVENSRVGVCTASEKMSKQIQTVLLNFGIVSTRAKKYNKEFKTYAYVINMYGENIDLFHREIGFGCSRKKDRLSEAILIKRNTNKNVIPYQRYAVNNFFSDMRAKNSHKPLLYDKFYHTRVGNNELTYGRIDSLLDEYGVEEEENLEYFKELKDANYFYSKVKTIENSENHVYDLQMPETKSFIANGIVSHNTFIQLMYNCHTMIFYPNIEIAMTAQTKENASALVGSKWKEIERFYPIIKNELMKEPSIGKDKATVDFKSGGCL